MIGQPEKQQINLEWPNKNTTHLSPCHRRLHCRPSLQPAAGQTDHLYTWARKKLTSYIDQSNKNYAICIIFYCCSTYAEAPRSCFLTLICLVFFDGGWGLCRLETSPLLLFLPLGILSCLILERGPCDPIIRGAWPRHQCVILKPVARAS